MNRLLLSAMAAGTMFTGSAIALAQSAPPPPPPHGHRLFEEMDANHDGVVTRAEATALLEKRFAELDANHDGKISPEERQAKRQADRDRRRAERFAALDTDKNGQLSLQEFSAPRPERGPDGNGPGLDGMGPGGAHHGGMRHGGPKFGWGRGPDRGPEGDVTKADFMRPGLTYFDLLDSNDDGKITMAERDAAMTHHRGGPRPIGPDGIPPKS